MEDIVIKINKDPQNYDLNLELGFNFLKKNNLYESKKIFEKLILIDNKRHEGYLNLSVILNNLNESEKAEKILEKYLSNFGYNKHIVSSLASLYYNNNNFEKLNKLIKNYIDLESNYLLYFLQSVIFEKDNNFEKQKQNLKKTIKLNKKFWLAYENLFNLYEKTNKISKFFELVTSAKKIFINEPKLKYYTALCFYRKNNEELALKFITQEKIEQEFIKLNYISYLISLYDLLSKIYLQKNKYKFSLKYAIKRNSISIQSKKNKKYNKQIILDTINKYKNFYKSFKHPIKTYPNSYLFHKNLVFLIGFPRSGTTLLDSILRSHSKTNVLEEKPYLLNLRHEYFKNNSLENILNISKSEVIKFQNNYFNSFDYDESKITIDKFPLNIIELGFIKKIFPNSKIILALRHPLDTILSCVLTSFKINEAMANYENLETSAFFYNEVFDLFKTYKKQLNLRCHEVKYENVVSNFNEEIEKLLTFVGLKFENSVKKYHITAKNRDKINTPSYNQVVKPIYKKSLYRHKKYPETDIIKPLVNDWINYFGY
tara:strand:- start:3866 stop:5494 length:1629 start_codon:yes stop_codon:yes gene_type:complete